MAQPSPRSSAPTSTVMLEGVAGSSRELQNEPSQRHRVSRKRSADDMEDHAGSFAASSSSSSSGRRNSYPSAHDESPGSTSGDDSNSVASLSGGSFASPGSSGMMVLSRDMRNKAEKLRRDKLNGHILKLGDLLPTVNMAPKRMDKTSVLRLASNFLRCHRSILNHLKGTKPQEWPNAAKIEEVLENFEGFMLIMTGSGKVLYVSDAVEKMFGHAPVDLLGNFIYTILHPEDAKNVAFSLRPSPGNSNQREYRKICCRIAERSLSRTEPCRYVYMCVSGLLRHMTDVPTGQPADTDKNAQQASACSSSQPDRIPLSFLPSAFGRNAERSMPAYTQPDDWMFISIVTPVRSTSIVELSLYQATQDEYFTRHCLDGRIINADQRISIVAGYTVSEVIGHSGFAYVVDDDKAMAAILHHDMLYSSRDGSVVVTYRLRSKSNGFIFLRTKGFLEFNRMSGTCESFICINTLISSAEGLSDLRKQVEQCRNARPPALVDPYGPRYNPARGWFGNYPSGVAPNPAFSHGPAGAFHPGMFPSGAAVAAAAAAASFGSGAPFQISPSSLGPFSTHSPTLSVPLAVPIRHRLVHGPPRFTTELFKDSDHQFNGASRATAGHFSNGFADFRQASASAMPHGFVGSGNSAFGPMPAENPQVYPWPSTSAQAPSAEPANPPNGSSAFASNVGRAPVDKRLARFVGSEEEKALLMMPNLNPLPQSHPRNQGPNGEAYGTAGNKTSAQFYSHAPTAMHNEQDPGPSMPNVAQQHMGSNVPATYDPEQDKSQNGQVPGQQAPMVHSYGGQQPGEAAGGQWHDKAEGPWGQPNGGIHYLPGSDNYPGSSYNVSNYGNMSSGQPALSSSGMHVNYNQQTSAQQYNSADGNTANTCNYQRLASNELSTPDNGGGGSGHGSMEYNGLTWPIIDNANGPNGSMDKVSHAGLITSSGYGKNDSGFLGSVANAGNNMGALGTSHHANSQWELKYGPHR